MSFFSQLKALSRRAAKQSVTKANKFYDSFSTATQDIGGTRPLKQNLDSLGFDSDFIPETPGIGEITGNVVNTFGKGIGGAVGAVGQPIANLVSHKPLFQGEWGAIKNTANATGDFGQKIGEKAAPIAAASILGDEVINKVSNYRTIKNSLPWKKEDLRTWQKMVDTTDLKKLQPEFKVLTDYLVKTGQIRIR